jgi:6-phosphogluconolactonase (cycloisomerase 2 family)
VKNLYTLALTFASLVFSISKSNGQTITSFTPLTAKPGDAVTITGSGFNTTSANNVVFLGATRATVTSASATSLMVTVPIGATYAPIIVLNTGTSLAAYSLANFTPTYSPAKTSITSADFIAKQDFTTGTNPISVAIGDLDGDGKPDLVVANQGPSTVSVYRNASSSGSISSSSFATKVDFTTATDPQSVAIGDLDGDGKPDLAVANFGSNTVSVFRNTSSSGSISSSSFATKVDFTAGSNPQSVAIGDLDGDGKPDLVVANFGSSTVSVFHNTSSSGSISSSSFATKVDFTTGTSPVSVAIGDVDVDGKPDLVVANYNSATVSVYRNTSSSGSISSSSFAAKVDFTTGSNPISVAIGDLDGDGMPDLAVANSSPNTVSIYRNTSSSGSISSSSFAAKVDFTTGTDPRSVAIGDLDGDGKPDLAVANYNPSTVSIFRNISSSGSISSSSFAAKVDYTTGTSPRSVIIGDLDGDGKPDLAVANAGSTSVSVLRNADLPPTITSFTPLTAKPGDAVTITGTGFNTTAANNVVFLGATKATVTAASATSLTVTVPTGATYAPITVLNTGASLAAYSMVNFTPTYSPAKTNITSTDFLAKQDFTAGTIPISVALGDLDGDGKPDLAVANRNSNKVSVFRNTSISGSISSSSFAAKVDFTTGSQPYSVAIGDLDGDGKLDLVVANGSSNTVSVFRNTSSSGSISSSSFAAKVDFTAGSNPQSVAIGDLDGDGKPDLVTANRNSTTVSVFRNTSSSGSISSSSFATKVDFTTGSNPRSVAIGDMDGDGKPDLALANAGLNTVSVFRNTSSSGSISSSSFAAKVDFTTGSQPISVAIGDLDGDGKPDLAVANYTSNTVSLYRNTSSSGSISSGSFATKVDFPTGSFPQSVAIGDLDGDGKPDLALANEFSSTVSVYRNTSSSGSISSSSFATKVDFPTGTDPISVAIGDLDGDGKSDLALANQGSNTVSIFRNMDLPPTITSFTPLTAKPGDAVTITGTGFNTTAANNLVFLGATRATVTAASAISLTVTVPTGATYAPITVLNTSASLAAYSLANFTPTYSPAKTSITSTDFLAKQDFTTGSEPYSVAIGDLDGDGKPDLAVANFNSNIVSVYRNTSNSGSINSSSFATKVDFTTGSFSNPRSVAIGDMDGDGKLDLVTANRSSNKVSVFRNTSSSGSISSSSFAAKVDFTTGSNPYSVAIGDLDGDGKPDLAVANLISNTVSVFRNTSSNGSISSSSFATRLILQRDLILFQSL